MPLFDPTRIGIMGKGGSTDNCTFAREKAARLGKYLTHTSSHESGGGAPGHRDGAIRLSDDLIFSFDGLPEQGREAAMLVLAEIHYCGREEEARAARAIAEQNDNHYWLPLHEFPGILVMN